MGRAYTEKGRGEDAYRALSLVRRLFAKSARPNASAFAAAGNERTAGMDAGVAASVHTVG